VSGASSATLSLKAASALEAFTGLGLVVVPSLLARLLFGSGLNGAGEATGRIAGLVMLCLAVGYWPRDAKDDRSEASIPLAALSWLAAAFLLVTGVVGANVGPLLWPAAALHVILGILLTRAWMGRERR
jgi:hypothetical protein